MCSPNFTKVSKNFQSQRTSTIPMAEREFKICDFKAEDAPSLSNNWGFFVRWPAVLPFI